MKNARLSWGIPDETYDAMTGTPGSLSEAALLSVYLFVWLLAMGAYLTVFVMTIMATLLLVIISLPCFLWSKVTLKFGSRRSG